MAIKEIVLYIPNEDENSGIIRSQVIEKWSYILGRAPAIQKQRFSIKDILKLSKSDKTVVVRDAKFWYLGIFLKVCFELRGLVAEESYDRLTGLRACVYYIYWKLNIFLAINLSKLITVVSEPMRLHVKSQLLYKKKVLNIPSIPWIYKELEIPKNRPLKICYSGSLNHYQCEAKLLSLFRANPHYKFVVISNDELSQKLPNVEKYSASNQKEVLEKLLECKYGLIFREDRKFNRVSSPTKIAEYLVAGLHVLYDNKFLGDWSVFLEKNACGTYLENLILELGDLSPDAEVIRRKYLATFSKTTYKKEICDILS